MSIEKQIYSDMVAAMKSNEILKRDTLRYLLSEIKQMRVDTRKELTDADVIKITKGSIKKRQDAIELFKQGGRQDLVDKNTTEIKLLEIYLPKQLSPEELDKIVTDTIARLGITNPKDTGRVMKEILSVYGSQTDGKTVQQIVSSKLSVTN